ncbi:putative lipase/esterase family protein [Mariannaea sp. PMI_226]|nr:putative lipase/esterase family protein [Mariannaea sp. PMI_226]
MIISTLRTLHSWFRPLLVAVFKPGIRWEYRWRLLLLQPLALLTNIIGTVPYLLSAPFTVEHITISPGLTIRVLVYKTTGTGRGRRLRPLHVDIHGGAFIGGLPENTAEFDQRIAKETGAVVVSITHRYAPEHVFPAAIDDVDATIRWLHEHAESRWGADAALMTTSGSSAGGNLALAATQQMCCQPSASTAIKAVVMFYAPIDLRLKPIEKPRPAKFPSTDPLAVLQPLFDSYVGPVRAENMNNPRMSPILAKRETLPNRILVVVAGVDILVAELMSFAERVNQEDHQNGETGRVEVLYDESVFHGYLELPDAIVGRETKDRAFSRSIQVLREAYAEHGWTWEV